MKKLHIKPEDMKNLTKWPVGYGRNFRVMVPYPENPREGVCDACGKSVSKGEISVTALHHWIYAYKRKTVSRNPLLVLDNCSEFCFGCHGVADALRTICTLTEKRLWIVVRVALLMPEKMKEKLDWIARAWLKARERDKTRKGKITAFIRKT